MPTRIRSSFDAFIAGGVAAGIAAGALLVAAGPARADTGGMTWEPTPEVKRVTCIRECASRTRPRAGGRIRIVGRNISGVRKVVFHGGRGTADDRSVRVRPRSDRSVVAKVPMSARSGRISVWTAGDVRAASRPRVSVLPPPAPEANPTLTPVPGPSDPGAPQLETGTSTARFFYGTKGRVRFSYRVSDSGPVSVTVNLLRAGDGAVVRSWPATVQPGQVHEVVWDGLDGAGVLQPEGRYAFRVVAQGQGGATARSAQAEDAQRDAFDFYGHLFPVRGRHDYGGDAARFGAGRSGHSHQGHDVFARCGTRLKAARGGRVKFKQYHSAAGHYIVIDGENTDVDYAYMHLQYASPFEVGDRVYTGQEIGRVGDTGRASGCHLHFEMWSAPGWYDGGKPFDPYPHLLAWDAYS